MRINPWIVGAAILLGTILGPWALTSSHVSTPIHQTTLILIFWCMALGMVFVVGLQFFRPDPTWARLGIRGFIFITAILLGTGLSSAILNLFVEGPTPSGFLFLVMALGFLAGLMITFFLFRLKYKEFP